MLDASASMAAVMSDVPDVTAPPPKKPRRFDVAKRLVGEVIAGAPGDRVGLAVFARDAFVVVPPTMDRTMLERRLSELAFNQIDPTGTGIGTAIVTGLSVLRKVDDRTKILVVVSDADPGNEGISPAEAARVAASLAVRLVTVQIGSPGEVEVESGVDLFGKPVFSPHRFDGDTALFQRLAGEHRGRHFVVTDAASFGVATREALGR
jgi:Ca-activated chloride channel family protein